MKEMDILLTEYTVFTFGLFLPQQRLWVSLHILQFQLLNTEFFLTIYKSKERWRENIILYEKLMVEPYVELYR